MCLVQRLILESAKVRREVCQLEGVGSNPSELVPLSPSFYESPNWDFRPLKGSTCTDSCQTKNGDMLGNGRSEHANTREDHGWPNPKKDGVKKESRETSLMGIVCDGLSPGSITARFKWRMTCDKRAEKRGGITTRTIQMKDVQCGRVLMGNCVRHTVAGVHSKCP